MSIMTGRNEAMGERKLGTNMKRLMIYFISRIAIPPGGGIADGITLFTEPGKYAAVARQALEQADIAITAMRAAPDNPYGDDEETIAGAIVDNLENELNKRRDDR